MFASKKYSPIRIITAITFVIMVIMNGLANALPINGQTSGEVSDYYANLFAPAGYTFTIWGLIYALLFVYTIYQLGMFRKKGKDNNTDLLDTIGIIFSVSSIANAIWILAWHYNIIWLSLILIIIMLVSLIAINREIKNKHLSFKEKVLVRLPFSIYFGWLTVATIANVTTFLVSINWNGFGIPETIWTVIILAVGFLIATAVITRNRDIAYGLVIIWAYTGILVKHSSQNGFAGAYPSIISVVSVCIAFLVVVEIYTLFKPKNKEKYI